MPIVYKQHLDTRDGTIYPCVLMPDGKWWSAVNLKFYAGGESVPYNANSGNIADYGLLYSYQAALISVPSGSHLPSNTEFSTLSSAIGATPGTKLKSATLWISGAGIDSYGFSLNPGGSGVWNRRTNERAYSSLGTLAALWTATPVDSTHAYSWFANTGSNLGSGSDSSDTGSGTCLIQSVRFIVDVFNEPVPSTKIKGTFSGSGVRVFAAMPSDSTFEVPLSAQSTTELTISKDFISTWGAAIGRVRILVVDGEYISEWKDWDFRA